MALPEDQMLAPHVVAGAPDPPALGGAPNGTQNSAPNGATAATTARPGALTTPSATTRPAAPESRMVALVIDPAVVGTDAVASVSPHEIPAYEPPAPAVSSHVPDYERLPPRRPRPGRPRQLEVAAGKPVRKELRNYAVAGVRPGSVRYERFGFLTFDGGSVVVWAPRAAGQGGA